MAKRKSTKKEVIDTKEMEIIEISQTEEVVNNNNNDLNVEKEEDFLNVTEDIINEEIIDSIEENVTTEVDSPQMVKNSVIKPIENKIKKINPMVFGYVWNGQEFD